MDLVSASPAAKILKFIPWSTSYRPSRIMFCLFLIYPLFNFSYSVLFLQSADSFDSFVCKRLSWFESCCLWRSSMEISHNARLLSLLLLFFSLHFRQKSLGCAESRECSNDRSLFPSVNFPVRVEFRKCQRKILLMQLTKENRVIEETNDLLVYLWPLFHLQRARERLRIVYLVVNIIFSWLSLPYLGILQVITLFLYYQGIVFALCFASF